MERYHHSKASKTLAVTLSVVLLCSTLAACGSGSGTGAGQSDATTLEVQESSAAESAVQSEPELPVETKSESQIAFETGWELAQKYMAAEQTLKSDPDSSEEYMSIEAVEEEVDSKKEIDDDWLIEDSLDDFTNETLDVSMRYYDYPEKEEISQAQEIVSDYVDYCQSSSSPDSFTEYAIRKGYAGSINELLPSRDNLPKIIEEEDLEEAANYIKGKKLTLIGVSKEAKDFLKSLKTRFEKKNTDEISNEELLAISQLIDYGEFTAEDFAITTPKIVTPKYILKRALSHVDQKTVIEFAVKVAPMVIDVIKQAVKEKKISLDEWKTALIDNSEAAKKLLDGVLFAVIEEVVKTGWLGDKYKDLSEEQIAELVLVMSKVIVHVANLAAEIATGADAEWGKFAINVLKDVLPIIINNSGLKTEDGTSQLISPAYLASTLIAYLMQALDGSGDQKDIKLKMADASGIEVPIMEETDEGNIIEGYFKGFESVTAGATSDDIVVTLNDSTIQIKMAA